MTAVWLGCTWGTEGPKGSSCSGSVGTGRLGRGCSAPGTARASAGEIRGFGGRALAALARQDPREVEQSQRRETVMPPGIWEKSQRNTIFISGSQFYPLVRKHGLKL